MIDTSRRSLITGLISLVAAPAIVRATSLMPVKSMNETVWDYAIDFASPNGDWTAVCKYVYDPIARTIRIIEIPASEFFERKTT